MRNITFILFPNMIASSLTLPLEMLNAADNIHRSEIDRTDKLTIQLAGATEEPITTSGGLRLLPNTTLDAIKKTDLLIIPGLWRSPVSHIKKNPEISAYLTALMNNHESTLICAVGTGSIFLADAGLLDDRAATTHWYYFKLMKSLYPKVLWKSHHLITQSGNIYCTASVNSIADLTVRFIELGYSKNIARRVESHFSPEIRRAYDNYLFDDNIKNLHKDEVIASAQSYIHKHSATTINFQSLADTLDINYRSFQRRFKEACHYSPLQYQQLVRVQSAKELLQQSDLNIQDIAELVGYVDASHFSGVFKNHTEQTPKLFREAVRGKLFRA